MSVVPAGREAPHSPSAALGRAWLAALLLVILVLYLYPLAATRAHLGPSPLPPLFAPDLYLYLNVSNLQAVGQHVVANPWYGLPAPEAASGYGKFGLSFRVFRGLLHLLGNSWWIAVALWTALWTFLICLAVVWLLRRLLPEGSGLLLGVSTALLLLVDLRALPSLPSAWLHLPSLRGFEGLAVPYVRSFFPQVVIPLVLVYVGLQMSVLRERRWKVWLGMGAIQWLAFVVFPYAMLLMAVTTGIILLLGLLARRLQLGYAQFAGFGALCALLDAAYLVHLGSGGVSAGPLIALQPALLLHLLLSKTLGLVVLVTALVCVVRAEQAEVKWTLVSLGSATVLLLLGEGVLSPALQISHHTLYFVHTVVGIQLAYLLGALYPAAARRVPRIRWAAAILLAGMLLHGALVARGNYRTFLTFNQAQKEEANILVPLNLQADDLVIADARYVDDTSCWLPLVSRARVLFCRNAEFALAPEELESVQDRRLAFYLYFSGWDEARVSQLLSPEMPSSQQDFLSLTQERLALEGPERAAALAALKSRLLPALASIENRDPAAQQFLRQSNRVVVIYQAEDPTFSRARLESYFQITGQQQVGNSVLLWCKPL